MDEREYEELLAEHDPSVQDETREETDRLAEEAMDPNADLIGFQFPIYERMWTVTGTASWSDGNYVKIMRDDDGDITVRAAGLVRAAKKRAS